MSLASSDSKRYSNRLIVVCWMEWTFDIGRACRMSDKNWPHFNLSPWIIRHSLNKKVELIEANSFRLCTMLDMMNFIGWLLLIVVWWWRKQSTTASNTLFFNYRMPMSLPVIRAHPDRSSARSGGRPDGFIGPKTIIPSCIYEINAKNNFLLLLQLFEGSELGRSFHSNHKL
jgi:hypothetical protein